MRTLPNDNMSVHFHAMNGRSTMNSVDYVNVGLKVGLKLCLIVVPIFTAAFFFIVLFAFGLADLFFPIIGLAVVLSYAIGIPVGSKYLHKHGVLNGALISALSISFNILIPFIGMVAAFAFLTPLLGIDRTPSAPSK